MMVHVNHDDDQKWRLFPAPKEPEVSGDSVVLLVLLVVTMTRAPGCRCLLVMY